MRKRIVTALLAAAMMLSLLAGCYTETTVPVESTDTNVTTSAQSETPSSSSSQSTTTSQTTTSQTTTTSTSSTSSKKSPTTARFPYSLIKRLKSSSATGGNNGGGTGAGDNGGGTGGGETETANNYYDEYRAFTSVADRIMNASKRNMNRDNPTAGGFWKPTGLNLVTDMYYDDPESPGDADSTLWPYGAYMEGVGAQLAAVDGVNQFAMEEYEKLLKNVDRFTVTELSQGDYLALQCVQGTGGAQIFNDDNVWIALEWLNAYKITGDQEYLSKARRNLNFIFESWDDAVLGGGIWWMTPGYEGGEKLQKNACINAPYAWAAAELYQITGEEIYLTNAKLAYDWTKNNLWDSNRNLIWDKYVQSTTGGYDRDSNEFAYNTGCMIGAAALLYEITEDPSYREDAYLLAEGSAQYFFTPRVPIRTDNSPADASGATGYYFNTVTSNNASDLLWFHSNLIKGIFQLYNSELAVNDTADPTYARIALNAVSVFAVNTGKTDSGFVNPAYRDPMEPALSNISPKGEGTAARMMYMCDEFLRDHEDFQRIAE